MFTRNDLISYLSDLEAIETNMLDIYSSALDLVDDSGLKKTFKALIKAESEHKDLVNKLRSLIIRKSVIEG